MVTSNGATDLIKAIMANISKKRVGKSNFARKAVISMSISWKRSKHWVAGMQSSQDVIHHWLPRAKILPFEGGK